MCVSLAVVFTSSFCHTDRTRPLSSASALTVRLQTVLLFLCRYDFIYVIFVGKPRTVAGA